MKLLRYSKYIWVFLVFTIPLSRIFIGPLPVYIIDIVIILILTQVRISFKRNLVHAGLFIYILFSLTTGLWEAGFYGYYQETIYMTFRYLLAYSAFFISAKLFIKEIDFKILTKAFIIILLANGLIASLFSLPYTGDFVEQYLFGNSYLFPQRAYLQELTEQDREVGLRAEGLVGGSNILAYVILTGLVFSFYLFKNRNEYSRFWKLLNYVAIIIGFAGLFFTDSRQMYLGFGLLLLYIFITGKASGMKRMGFFLLGIIIVGLSFINFGDTTFRFSRIQYSYDILKGEQDLGRGEKSRILSYQFPFILLSSDPAFWVRGRGYANKKIMSYQGIKKTELDIFITQGENHSFLSSAIYDRGAIATIGLLIMVGVIIFKSFYSGIKQYNKLRTLQQMLVIPLIPPILFAHFFINSLQGAYMFFIVLGWIYHLNDVINFNSITSNRTIKQL